VFSTSQASTSGNGVSGPVFTEFTVEHPFSTQGHFKTTLRVYQEQRRIELSTRILNNDQFVRYRVLFPTNIVDGKITQEIPFGASQRPDGIEFPAQNWMDYSNGQQGMALLNRGLPGNNTADGTMMLSLLRSTCIVAYGFGGGYEPGMSSDTGFELGKELSFDYALVPHRGSWQEAGIYRDGLEFNHPLLVNTAANHPGRLPARSGFLDIDQSNIIVSALKTSLDGCAVLRLYEASGVPAESVSIKFSAQVNSAEETNLMEDPGTKLVVTGSTIVLDFKPFEIKTVKLSLA
jgi:alpha-mannosidase